MKEIGGVLSGSIAMTNTLSLTAITLCEQMLLSASRINKGINLTEDIFKSNQIATSLKNKSKSMMLKIFESNFMDDKNIIISDIISSIVDLYNKVQYGCLVDIRKIITDKQTHVTSKDEDNRLGIALLYIDSVERYIVKLKDITSIGMWHDNDMSAYLYHASIASTEFKKAIDMI